MSDTILPEGFHFSTTEAQIKKAGRPDMALICSKTPASASATFTTNRIKGAPVKLCMGKIKSGRAQAVIINSGNANVSTGKRGMKDAHEMAGLTARYLRIPEELVYVCSTGVIGVPLPIERIRPKIPELVNTLGSADSIDVAKAIMTTDTFPKSSMRQIKIGQGTGTILGICKGAGMIAPHMATMLAFFMTDMEIEKNTLKKAFSEAVECSFNRLTIDGDMSTSDTAIIMANGMLGNRMINTHSRHYNAFKEALGSLARELSRAIAKDGEGATKLIEIEIKGAKKKSDAIKAGFSVANSPLVKTAMYGADVNWGRIMAALGYSGVDIKEEKIDIYMGDVKVVGRGVGAGNDNKAKKVLMKKEIKITINLNLGAEKATILTCDLTEGYVRVNAAYKT